jgi:predicted GNAT family acetyltransferase
MAEPRVVDVPERQRYELILDGDVAGFVTYHRAPGGITFMHTQIEDAYEGHGLGGTLAAAALDDARAKGLRVKPVCPFIQKYIEEHTEYADLVAPDFDAR